MSNGPFPEHVTPRKWCDRNGTINSSVPLGKLLRLSEYLEENHGQATVCLSFDRDASGCCCLTGTVTASVNMQCQRCLEPVTVDLASELDIKVAADQSEADRIADSVADRLDRLEIIVCDDGELNLLSVIEDELIMSLPIVASHADAQCSVPYAARLAQSPEDTGPHQGNIRGMDVLEKLKHALEQERSAKGHGSNSRQDNESDND